MQYFRPVLEHILVLLGLHVPLVLWSVFVTRRQAPRGQMQSGLIVTEPASMHPDAPGIWKVFIVSQEVGRTRSDLSKQSKVTAGIPWRVLSFMTVAQREKAELMAQTCNPWG